MVLKVGDKVKSPINGKYAAGKIVGINYLEPFPYVVMFPYAPGKRFIFRGYELERVVEEGP